MHVYLDYVTSLKGMTTLKKMDFLFDRSVLNIFHLRGLYSLYADSETYFNQSSQTLCDHLFGDVVETYGILQK